MQNEMVVLGEGSGAMILEEYDHAKRGAKIYAEVIGEYVRRCLSYDGAASDGLGAKNTMMAAIEMQKLIQKL